MEDYEDLKLLLNEVFKERHIDFSQYREQLIQRRVAVRLRVTQCHSYAEYIDFLKTDRQEMDALFDALTMSMYRKRLKAYRQMGYQVNGPITDNGNPVLFAA